MVKSYLRLCEREFCELEYVDVTFYSEHIAEEKANSYRETMEAASFTAWQILRSKGLKKTFKEWLKAHGLQPEKRRKIDKKEKEELKKKLTSLFEKIERGK